MITYLPYILSQFIVPMNLILMVARSEEHTSELQSQR